MTAAFYRFNDINRMKQLASNDWYLNKEAWDTCWTNLSDPLLAEDPNALRLTDFILNVVYNAGSYSAPLQSYLNVCVKKDPAQLANMNNYNLNPQDYRDAIGSPDTTGDTYYRYPRQVSFYIDQLFGVNLEDAGLNINNQVSLLAGQFNRVFAFAVTKLSYKPNKDKEELTFVTASQADKAFKDALAQLAIKSTDSFKLSNDSDRKAIYQLLDVAIGNVEKTIGSDFNAVTDKGPIDPTSEIQIYTDAKIQGQMFLSASKAGANIVNNWMTPNTHISLPVDASIDQMKDSGVDCTAQAQSAFAKLASEADPEHPQQIQFVGVRLSPVAYLNIEHDDRDKPVFDYVLEQLNQYDLAYVHTGMFDDSYQEHLKSTVTHYIRQHYHGSVIACGGYNSESARKALLNDDADLVAIGRPLIANPDYVEKTRQNINLTPYDVGMLNTLV